MKRTKQQKGITLIALIITIVVLLILAAVAISSIQENGILGYAQNAAKEYNQSVINEQGMLGKYENFLNKYNGSSTEEKTYTVYTIGQTVSVGDEEFYVIADDGETAANVTLFAKDCVGEINAYSFGGIDLEAIGGITYPYDFIPEEEPDTMYSAVWDAYWYGKNLGGTGRLMTEQEARNLFVTHPAMILGTDASDSGLDYWLATVKSDSIAVMLAGAGLFWGEVDSPFFETNIVNETGVRPIVEIPKDLVTQGN